MCDMIVKKRSYSIKYSNILNILNTICRVPDNNDRRRRNYIYWFIWKARKGTSIWKHLKSNPFPRNGKSWNEQLIHARECLICSLGLLILFSVYITYTLMWPIIDWWSSTLSWVCAVLYWTRVSDSICVYCKGITLY